MKTKLAKSISIIGNPILTVSLFAVVSFFINEEIQKAFLHSLLIVAGVSVPLIVRMYRGTRNGTYSNFDISDRQERQSWYLFPITIVLIVTSIFYFMGSSHALCLLMFSALALLIISQVVNYFVKCSLHVSFNTYLSFLILPHHVLLALMFMIFTAFIAWSRWELKRHSIKEIIVGLFIGFAVGVFVFLTI